jgi:isopenicillin N synthase-like dioxygenase
MSATVDQSPGSEEADLHVLNFCSLQRGDESEKANLLSACEEHRFFYLDLRDWESGEMLHNLEEIWNIMKKWFDQPLQEKLKTETISDAHGWVAELSWEISNTDIV